MYEPILNEVRRSKKSAESYGYSVYFESDLDISQYTSSEVIFDCLISEKSKKSINELKKRKQRYSKIHNAVLHELGDIIRKQVNIFAELREKLKKGESKIRGLKSLPKLFLKESYVGKKKFLKEAIEGEISYSWFRDQFYEISRELKNKSSEGNLREFLEKVRKETMRMDSLEFFMEERKAYLDLHDRAIQNLEKDIKKLESCWKFWYGRKRVDEMIELNRKVKEGKESISFR